jgi:Tfp pilus assembly protein PilE
VTGSYSNTVTTSDANAVRTQASSTAAAFDSYYGTSPPTFGANGSADSAAASADASAAASSASTAVVTDPTASPTGLSAVLAVAVCGVGIWAVQRGKRKKGGE